MSRPRLLDLFCGAGGAAMGYHRAGFDVVGVDCAPQPNYPFEFVQGDAMTYPLDGFAAIHASPPCGDHSVMSVTDHETGWMLDATIDRLTSQPTFWVVENVVGPTVRMAGWWFILCGSMFGLQVQRHRRFGSSHLFLPPPCHHVWEAGRPYTITGTGGSCDRPHSLKPHTGDWWRYLDMPWMEGQPHYGVAQAIPPAYTEWIGSQLLAHLAAA
jgi:DNA (cytosine-5)-methyltransferase 1